MFSAFILLNKFQDIKYGNSTESGTTTVFTELHDYIDLHDKVYKKSTPTKVN